MYKCGLEPPDVGHLGGLYIYYDLIKSIICQEFPSRISKRTN